MTHDIDDNLVRLHEQRMAGTEAWCDKLEKKVDKIPWILFFAVFNVCLTMVTIFLKWR
jgi:hypothetical protein